MCNNCGKLDNHKKFNEVLYSISCDLVGGEYPSKGMIYMYTVQFHCTTWSDELCVPGKNIRKGSMKWQPGFNMKFGLYQRSSPYMYNNYY